MTGDAARNFTDAVNAAGGDDPFSRLRRASLEALAAKHPDLAPARPLPLTMHLEDPSMSGHAVPAVEAGQVLERFQRAVARVAKARRTRVSEVKRVTRADFLNAQLDVFAAAPGSLNILLRPHSEEPVGAPAQGEIAVGESTWAEQAIVELLRILPEDEKDSAALDAIVVADPVVRRAINDLVQGRPSSLQMDFSLDRPIGEPVRGSLSPAQSKVLRAELSESLEDEVVIELRRGRLDGVRTRRRIFYLEVPGGTELHGLVDEALLPDVLSRLEKTVVVQLQVVTTRARSGRAAQRRYRLIGISDGTEETTLPFGPPVSSSDELR